MYNQFSSTIPDNERNRRYLADIKAAAEKYEKEPIKDLPFSKYMIYFQTGSRLEYEAAYIEHRRRLNVYALMALSTKEEKWIKGLEDILWAVCNEYTWAFPAHLKDVTDINECAITIDLFSADTGVTLSEICHILEGYISPIVRDRVEKEIRRRIIQPYKERNLKFHTDNWSAVCAGGVGMCTMYWGGWEEYQIVHPKVIDSIQEFIDSYAEDGCCLEGALYWGGGFGYFTYYAEMLRELSGGEIDLFKNSKVHEIALFPTKVYLEKDDVIPFSDAAHNYNYRIGLIHFLAKEYEEAQVFDEKYAMWFDEDYRYKFVEAIRDLFWYTPGLTKTQENKAATACHIFKQSQWYINKQEDFCLAVKGGRNNEPHNHNDLGHIVLYSHGKYILDDLGWPEYDSEYFGVNRYQNLCASSAGHSVPIINGQHQLRGRIHNSKMLEANESMVKFELAGAYEDGLAKSFVRCVKLDENQKNKIWLEDSFEEVLGEIRERFITRIPPVIRDNKVMIDNWVIECADKDCTLEINKDTFKPRLDICKMDMKPVEEVYLIDFVVQSDSTNKNISFTIKQIEE